LDCKDEFVTSTEQVPLRISSRKNGNTSMAYDEGLAYRVRECLQDRPDVEERRMFGGLCFMVRDHMCCGILGDMLMGRVGPRRYQECQAKPYAREMDFTGRSLKGMVYVLPEGISEDASLSAWVSICTEFVESLPPKR
jgi:TfoX/Sxy family transcriptional regulator of competence genes